MESPTSEPNMVSLGGLGCWCWQGLVLLLGAGAEESPLEPCVGPQHQLPPEEVKGPGGLPHRWGARIPIALSKLGVEAPSEALGGGGALGGEEKPRFPSSPLR